MSADHNTSPSQFGEVRRVEIDKVHATGHTDPQQVTRHLAYQKAGVRTAPPKARESGDGYHVDDHHAVLAAKARGETHVDVHVVSPKPR